MLALILFFTFSHLFSFLCSILESVLLSCTPAYILLLKKRGSKAANHLGELKRRIDRPLSAILTWNTIAHTVGAAGVGASVVELFGEKSFALASVILTLTMLYWTEMIPKTIGALYWKKIAPLSIYPIQWMIFTAYPFVLSFNFFARLFSRSKREERVTEEDIRLSLEAGVKAGAIEEEEQHWVENIFRLGDRKVGMLMRPRVDIEWINLMSPIDSIREQILASKHHIFPACENDVDNVLGLVDARDLLESVWQREEIEIRKTVKPPLFVNENTHIFELIELFRKHHTSFGLVTDEYGTIQGVITTKDIMKAIVREVEEEEEVNEAVVKLNNHSWLISGKMPIDEFKEVFHISHLPQEEKGRYRTVAGLCLSQLGYIPKKGDGFSIDNFYFEIFKMKKRRIEKVLIKIKTI